MAQYSIKDLERLSGIKAHTIRIWEKRYELVQPGRTSTNIRLYSDSDLKRILNVSVLNRNGIKISRIAGMDESEINEKVTIISRDSSDYDSLIENLVVAMVDLDDRKVEKLLSKSFIQVGFEECILKIAYPFLGRIGTLWQTGAINPAQEHFISNLIRQKLIVGIDSLIPVENSVPKHFLLFLPEGELHELGLLFYSYLLQKRGHRVTYLGQWVPLKEMVEASSSLDIGYLLTSITSVHSGEELTTYLDSLSGSYPEKTIFISGYQVENLEDQLPGNMIRLRRSGDLLPYLP
ncbi:MAG: MerR family transcriptional regulator [Thermodesulfovibrionia bacterium]|nr:MerR family transcriptional regulator [Thermodesulfovibrionia bacterium]